MPKDIETVQRTPGILGESPRIVETPRERPLLKLMADNLCFEGAYRRLNAAV